MLTIAYYHFCKARRDQGDFPPLHPVFWHCAIVLKKFSFHQRGFCCFQLNVFELLRVFLEADPERISTTFGTVRCPSRLVFFSFFRSRKKFSTTYAIVRAVFFSPDLFMKISNFSKTVHTIFTKFCTVILHPKGPLRVQRHQNRMAGM